MADVKWIKLVADMFDNRKIKQIRKMPDGDAIIVIWLHILCLAGQVNDNGLVYFSHDIPYTDEMLATEFDRPINTVRLALQVFQQFGMIEIVNNILLVSNWEKYQSATSLEEMKEKHRLRQQKYREKQKQLISDVTVTSPVMLPSISISNSISNSKDIDKGDCKGEKKQTGIFEIYADGDNLLLSALFDFEKMRKSIKKPLTDRAKKMLTNDLDKLADSSDTKVAILNQSIMHCWQTVYALKQPDAPQKSQPQQKKSFAEIMAERAGQ